jgi:hypothetical protein
MMAIYPTLPPGNTLAAIQQKVRRLTRSPSENQLTTDDLNNYINTFVIYDFPEHLRMFNLRTTFKFWTNPYQDVYPTDIASFGTASDAMANPLYNFQNRYLTVHDPFYVAGFQVFYTQSREQLFGIYPLTNSIQSINRYGDGTTTQFSGFIPLLGPGPNPTFQRGGACLIKGSVLFDSVDINRNGLSLVDVPVLDAVTGNPTIWGNLYPSSSDAYKQALITPPMASAPYIPGVDGLFQFNYINYVTGQYVITFLIPPLAGQRINSQTIPQVVSRPQAVLFFDNKFIVRPVPNQAYQVNFEAYMRPTQLFQTNSVPTLEEWWQYIAYGAAKKVFEDRLDMDSVQLILPEYKKQETLCLRRTIVQNTNERVATIYTEQTNFGAGSGFGWGQGGGPF